MRRWLSAVVCVSVIASVAVMTAGAAGTTTYHGRFTGPVVYQGCKREAPDLIAGGTWSVALHEQGDATVSVNIFANGEHHVSLGGTFSQLPAKKGEFFVVGIQVEAGPLTVSLKGAAFTYRIAPYEVFGISCQSATYSGVLTK
ncbi:MAG TPA: hypothetical protein VLB89_10265 [Gaiellaceae bacterium]|nr:hypothetical protein [Gaiellaceae bacterium]